MPPKGSKKNTAERGRVSQHGNGWRVRASIGRSTLFGPTHTLEAEADADLRLAQAASSEAQYVHVLQQLRATNELSTQQVQPSEPRRKRLRAAHEQPQVLVSTLKLAKITPYGVELPLSTVRVPLLSPVPLSSLSAATMQIAMEDANIIQHDAKICFHYKDEDDDFVLITDVHAAWPQGSDTDTVVKAWFSSAPLPPPPEQEHPPVAAKRDYTAVCKGPHMHQPSSKRVKKLNEVEFNGYSMLEAASAGCYRCVEYWLNRDVDANFVSINEEYNAMDFILWSKKQGTVSDTLAAIVVSTLDAHGGQPNKMK